jgi:hypothetical protein
MLRGGNLAIGYPSRPKLWDWVLFEKSQLKIVCREAIWHHIFGVCCFCG